MDKTTFINLLINDPIIINNLSGGVYGISEREISRTSTPAAFDINGIIMPCAYVRFEGNYPIYGVYDGAVKSSATIYLYEDFNSNVLTLVIERIYTLLNGAKPDGVWEIQFRNDVTDQDDADLMCKLAICNYDIIRIR